MPDLAPATEVAALAGTDGERLERLIESATNDGVAVLYRLTKAALGRLLAQGPVAATVSGSLFTPAELQELAASLSSVISTGDLLGRARIREQMQRQIPARFAEELPPPWPYIPETIPVLPPAEAVNYFLRLVPTLGIDPLRYGPAMQRAAFTLAHVTEQTVLSTIQTIILRGLASGQDWQTIPNQIDSVLVTAGIHPTNPQYSSMVFRTNAADAFNVGQVLEVQTNPEVQSFFPAWQYLGIRDGREGDDHRPHFDLYYPSSLDFHTVRGPRVFNCRCTPRYIDRYEWDRLQRSGAQFSGL